MGSFFNVDSLIRGDAKSAPMTWEGRMSAWQLNVVGVTASSLANLNIMGEKG